MLLSFLLDKLGIIPENNRDDVTGVFSRPEKIVPGCVFVCISGANADGHDCAAEALQKGAAAVIGEKDLDLNGYYRVPDSRLAFGILCSAYRGDPGRKLKLIGVTGTNGKTTTAEYIRFILASCGRKCGLIGTLGCEVDGESKETGFTTPEGEVLYDSLADMVDVGCEYCVMEVSSQALAQKRVDPLHFDIGVFTNLGSDHSDYHRSTDAYARAKARLAELSDTVVVNADDAYAEKFASFSKNGKVKYYSARNGLADYMANNIRYDNGRISYVLFCRDGVSRIGFNGIGEFSVYNSLAAAAACSVAGIPFADVARFCAELPTIPGRAQFIPNERGINICVDYAHTPEALSGILLALGPVTSGRLITVFGCGGERDSSKRPLMGRIAANMSSTVIITSDNPRSENEMNIIGEIKSGIRRKADIFTEPDREKAIALALNKAVGGDTVLIAGKGHEKTKTDKAGVTYFSDEACVKKLLG